MLQIWKVLERGGYGHAQKARCCNMQRGGYGHAQKSPMLHKWAACQPVCSEAATDIHREARCCISGLLVSPCAARRLRAYTRERAKRATFWDGVVLFDVGRLGVLAFLHSDCDGHYQREQHYEDK